MEDRHPARTPLLWGALDLCKLPKGVKNFHYYQKEKDDEKWKSALISERNNNEKLKFSFTSERKNK